MQIKKTKEKRYRLEVYEAKKSHTLPIAIYIYNGERLISYIKSLPLESVPMSRALVSPQYIKVVDLTNGLIDYMIKSHE